MSSMHFVKFSPQPIFKHNDFVLKALFTCNLLEFKVNHSFFRGKWHLLEFSFIWLFKIKIITFLENVSKDRITFFMLSPTAKEVFNRILTASKTECVQNQKHITCKWTQDIDWHITLLLIHILRLTLVPNHSVFFRVVSNLEHVVYICIKYFQVSVEFYWIKYCQVKSIVPP